MPVCEEIVAAPDLCKLQGALQVPKVSEVLNEPSYFRAYNAMVALNLAR